MRRRLPIAAVLLPAALLIATAALASEGGGA